MALSEGLSQPEVDTKEVQEGAEEAVDTDSDLDPLAMLGGMGEEEVYKVTLVDEVREEAKKEVEEVEEPAGDQVLLSFLRQLEICLLDLAADPQLPALPDDLASEFKADGTALLRLVPLARSGDLPAVLADDWLAGTVGAALSRDGVHAAMSRGGLTELRAVLRAACAEFKAAAGSTRGVGLLCVAVASLQLYMRANWTGPVCEDVGPFSLDDAKDVTDVERQFLDALDIDGEPAYEMLVGVGLLWLALDLLGTLPGAEPLATGQTLPAWNGRAAFAWQLSLADASERGLGQSPTLFQQSVVDLVDRGILVGEGMLTEAAVEACRAATSSVLGAWENRGRESAAQASQGSGARAPAAAAALAAAPGRIRAALIVELAARLCWYGRTKAFEAVLDAACAAIDFKFEVTGVMGIKRVYQTVEYAQLMVKTDCKSEESPAEVSKDGEGDGKAPENLGLSAIDDMNDVLEGPKVSESVGAEDRVRLEKPLSTVEQLILLARCHYIWCTGNPDDEMLLQEINALAQRVLQTSKTSTASDEDGPLFTANWLNFSTGLWYRCKAEHHRNKTRERAAFQLQSLVEQFRDEKPSCGHRLLPVHSAGYPAKFHMQRELGMRMMRGGMVSTAHEQFKKLKMWPEAVECLMIADRNCEAEDLLKTLLDTVPSPRLWCCLGDAQKEPKHFETAWELSNGRFARAQRSLGRHYFYKGELQKAVDSFKLALDINPMHSGIWFQRGVAELRLQRFSDAVVTFARCVAVEDENAEAWANLAAVHSALSNHQQARQCMLEATRRNRISWKMWESFLGICMQLRDIQGVIQANRRLIELECGMRVQERIVGMITMAVVSDAKGLYQDTTGKVFARQLDDFFKFMTEKVSSRAFVWRFWAELQDHTGQRKAALQSRLKQQRAAQAKLWEERDPKDFTSGLMDLRECMDVVASTLAEPGFKEEAQEHLQPFTFSVRDVATRLAAKMDTGMASPEEWTKELAAIQTLAQKLEDSCQAGCA